MTKPPLKKINWLKRLKLEIEDDELSDVTPQQMEIQRTDTKKEPVRDGEFEDVTIQNMKTKHKENSENSHKKLQNLLRDEKEKADESRRLLRQQRKQDERRQRVDTSKRPAKSVSVANFECMSGDKGHKTYLNGQDEKMVTTKEESGTGQPSMHSKAGVLVDSAKAKAAALRQRRMRKLRARRKATGEHARLAAFKLKRQEVSEMLRLKRNQREQSRKTGTISALKPTNDASKGENEPQPQPTLGFQEEDKKRKRVIDRHLLKPTKERAAKTKSELQTKSSLLADAKRRNREKRQEELRRVMGVEPRVSSANEVEPNQKRRKMQLERNNCITTAPEESAMKVVSEISPVKTPSRNKSEIRATGMSRGEEMTDSEPQQIFTGKGEEGKRVVVCSSLSVATITIGGVKREQDSVKSDGLQTEGIFTYDEERKKDLARDENLDSETEEEGQVLSPSLEAGESDKVLEPRSGEIIAEKDEVLLDMMPIPRKSFRHEPVDENAASFAIPKRSGHMQIEDNPASRADNLAGTVTPVLTPLLTSREPLRPQRKRKKNSVPVKNLVLSTEDRALLCLSQKCNSIFMAAKELALDPAGYETPLKMSTITMTGYDVLDTDGNVLQDLIPRLSCATKSEMSSDKDSFPASFYGASLSTPKAKETTCLTVDEEDEERQMGCYEELKFERADDRDFYQQRMYGATFVPLRLRGRTTLIVKKARFERKSTGIRFNQDRDREEFAAALSKRYTLNSSVPRCSIPRDNWKKLMGNQPGMVYLHYYNREAAELALQLFQDDYGNPLELKAEYKAGVHDSSPTAGGRSNRVLQRSYSSERSAPEPSPQPSHDSTRTTPYQRRECLRTANDDYRSSRYDRPPSAQVYGGWDEYEPSTRSSMRRSRSRSRPRPFHVHPHDVEKTRTEVDASAGTDRSALFSSERRVSNDLEVLSETGNEPSRDSVLATNTNDADKLTALPLESQSMTKNNSTCEQSIGSDDDEHEEGEIDSSELDLPTQAIPADDREVPSWSPLRCRQQSNDLQVRQRLEDFRHDSRNYSREIDESYYRYEDRNFGPNRRRSRSRSRSRPEVSDGGGRQDSWDLYQEERYRCREYGTTDPYAGYDRQYSDRYGGHDYRDGGGYNGRRDEYSRQY